MINSCVVLCASPAGKFTLWILLCTHDAWTISGKGLLLLAVFRLVKKGGSELKRQRSSFQSAPRQYIDYGGSSLFKKDGPLESLNQQNNSFKRKSLGRMAG